MKRILKITSILALTASLIGLVSCSSKVSAAGGEYFSEKSPALMSKKVVSDNLMRESADRQVSSDEAFSDIVNYERKIIYSGYLSLEVQNLDETKSSIENWVKSFGGYVASASQNDRYVSMNVKVPSKKFSSAMDAAGTLGQLKEKNVDSRDVSDQFYDLEARLETRKVMRERLMNYLEEEKISVEDMIKVESKLNSVTTEIESMQGQLNRLANQIDYSEINVYASLPLNHDAGGFIYPDAKEKFREFLGAMADFFVGLFFVILYIIVFGIPVILILALFYWLCFGKVGLVKKLFVKVSGKSKSVDGKSE